MDTEHKDTSLLGMAVGNYRVVDRLGAGAMGEVYLGEHPAIGRRVAIKVVMAALSANPEVTDRFLSEARAVSKVNHPNIIQIFDFGNLGDGRLYYVMEFLDGQDLSALLSERAPLPPLEATDLLRQITAAMEAAHRAGIVHRDLKPDNIFVADTSGGPLVKILDFGIAKLLEPAFGSESRTATGMIMGTPLYMSPEQAAGRVKEISPRTDIYALGVIAFEMLSGRCPFLGQTTAQMLTQHITEPPPSLRTFVSNLPAGLEACVLRALAKEPADRHQSMATFFEEFERASKGSDTALAPTLAGDVAAARTLPENAATGAAGTAANAEQEATLAGGEHHGRASSGTSAQVKRATDTTLGRAAAERVAPAEHLYPQGRSMWRLTLPLVLAVAVLAAAVGLWVHMRPGSTASKGGTPAPAKQRASTDSQGVSPAMDPPAPRPSKQPGPRPTTAIRRIRIVSNPARVTVRVQIQGAHAYTHKTPFTVQARDGERIVLAATRSGHRAETRTITVAGDGRVLFRLPPLPRTRRRHAAQRLPQRTMKAPPARAMPPSMRATPPPMRATTSPMTYGEATISPFGMK